MDAVFVTVSVGLWLSMVLMVWGLARLDASQGERS